jgi:hypothetical protein
MGVFSANIGHISAALEAHLSQQALTICRIWRLQLRAGQALGDGRTVLGFTDWDSDLAYDDGNGSVTYKAATGFAPTSVKSSGNMAVDNVEVVTQFDSDEISEVDMRAGRYDYAEITLMIVNPKDLTMGHMILRRGWIGEVAVVDDAFKAELRGLTQAFDQDIGELTSQTCRANLFDDRCKLSAADPSNWAATTAYVVGDIRKPTVYNGRRYEATVAGTSGGSEPTWPTTIGATVVDGGVTWECKHLFTKTGTIDQLVAEAILRLSFTNEVADTPVTLTNGDAESADTSNWTTTGSGTFANVTSSVGVTPHGGSRMFRLIRSSGTYGIRRDVSVPGGLAAHLAAGQLGFYATAYVYAASTLSQSIALRVQAFDASNALLEEAVTDGFASLGEWYALTKGLMLPADTSYVRIQIETTTGGTIYVDDVTAEWTVPDVSSESFFRYGTITITASGDNQNVVREISRWDPAAKAIELTLPFPFTPTVGDTFTISPGCDKLLTTCSGTFDNAINMRAEPHLPGQDRLMQSGKE